MFSNFRTEMHDVCYYITVNATVLYYTYKYVQYKAQKTSFFPKRPEKMVFPKKLCWNMIFYVLSGKMIFLFP